MKRTQLSEVCELITDGTHYTPPNVGNGYPFLTVKDMTAQGLDFSGCSRIAPEEFNAADQQNSAPVSGDVLFSKDGTVGKVHVVSDEPPFAVLSSIAIIRPKQGLIQPRFLSHLLRSPSILAQSEQRKTGSALRRIILKDIRQLEIPLPPLEEQKRIAAILDQADALRRLRRRALVRLNTLGQAIFHEMFDANTPEIPIVSLTNEIYRYPTYYGISYEDTGVLEVRGEMICADGSLSLVGVQPRFISVATSERFPKTRLSEGDVVMSVRGTIGKLGYVDAAFSGSNITANLMRISPDVSMVEPKYFWFALRTALKSGAAAAATTSTTIATIKSSDLKNIVIRLPKRAAQKDFIARLEAVEALNQRLAEGQAATETVFTSLQHRAFRGEL